MTDYPSTSRRSFLRGSLLALSGAAIGPVLTSGAHAFVSANFTIGACVKPEEAAMAKAAGAKYIEPGVRTLMVPTKSEAEFQKNLAVLRASGLSAPVCNSFISGAIKSVGPDHVKADVLAYAEIAFRRAKIAGVKQIVYGSGGSRRIPEGFSRETAKAQFIELLTDMAPLAQKYGVELCLEPLRSQECNFINSPSEAAEILDVVNHPSAMMVCDYYHVTQEGRGIEEVYAARKYITHTHIAENEGRRPPGTHGDDFKPFLNALRKIGFTGNISLECRWQDKPAEMAKAVKVLRAQADA